MYDIALRGQACGKLLDLLENIYGYPETKASKDFEASLQPHSLLDPEEEPEAEAIRITGDAGPGSSETQEYPSSKTVKHHSLKCPASEPLERSAGKGKAFKEPTGTPIEDVVAFLVILEKAITMTSISEGDLVNWEGDQEVRQER